MTDKQRAIIVVDDNNANLVACKNILKPFYEVYPAPSTGRMFELLEHIKPDLILLDVEMPDADGYEAARRLKGNDAFKDIPLIFLSARSDAKSEMEGLNLGALDYIHKPFFSALLLRRIEIHLSMIEWKKIIQDKQKTIEEYISIMNNKILPPLNSMIDTLNTARESDNAGKPTAYLNEVENAAKLLLGTVKEVLNITETKDNQENNF